MFGRSIKAIPQISPLVGGGPLQARAGGMAGAARAAMGGALQAPAQAANTFGQTVAGLAQARAPQMGAPGQMAQMPQMPQMPQAPMAPRSPAQSLPGIDRAGIMGLLGKLAPPTIQPAPSGGMPGAVRSLFGR